MKTELMNAILAMDSYNRGYSQGIILPVELNITKIGNAIIAKQVDISDGSFAQSIGFYALAYEYNGEKIIAYRGTDDVNGALDLLTSDDAYHGWTLGAGNTASEQGRMAIEFYQDVAGGDLLGANISLTGHSLGGGLAGSRGAISH